VENARLLLNSSFDEVLDKIGRYYSFHPRIETARIALSKPLLKRNSPYDWNSLNGTEVRTLIKLSEAQQQHKKLPNYAAILSVVAKQNLESYSALKRLRDRIAADRSAVGFFEDVVTFLSDINGAKKQWQNRHGNIEHQEYSVVTYMDQIPNPDSRIVLDRAKDMLGLRKSKVLWEYFDYERKSIIEFNKQIALGLGAANIGRLKIDMKLDDRNHFEKLMRLDSGGGHQIGTTRMSLDKTTGVVDKNCKLHGIDNLYCAGSSVFPTTSWINPTMTIVALASRLAEHLNKNT
jgi:choline dehydrogenase-like flavoprotein